MTRDDIHTCSYSCERPACIKAQRDELAQRLLELVAQAVAAEREACAEICRAYAMPDGTSVTAMVLEKAIRARGEV
jgi:hypothetical protein